jgi:hypothetical protein
MILPVIRWLKKSAEHGCPMMTIIYTDQHSRQPCQLLKKSEIERLAKPAESYGQTAARRAEEKK